MQTKNLDSSVGEMTTEDRTFQYRVLSKYRFGGFIPSLQQIARASGTSVSTAAKFVNGNSRNQKIQEYIIMQAKKYLKPIPDDLERLFEIWAKDTA